MGTFIFFEDGFEYGVTDPEIDFDYVMYKDIQALFLSGTILHICVSDDPTDTLRLEHVTAEGAERDLKAIREHMHKWFREAADRRKEERTRIAEEREFRASLLAHLGKLTERIAFDPDVGEEALDAIERCKKRARDGEE